MKKYRLITQTLTNLGMMPAGTISEYKYGIYSFGIIKNENYNGGFSERRWVVTQEYIDSRPHLFEEIKETYSVQFNIKNMDMANEYKSGNSYLVKPWNNSEISKMTVLEVTQTAYNIKWENGRNYWFLKKNFESDYNLIEDLGNLELKQMSQWLNSNKEVQRSVANVDEQNYRTSTNK